ncbi:MAG: ABC transporter permease [Peptoniphilus harei]|uniref:ABC transporter permease n=1 Tax=Finegoldia magna TaxID=1260 RepID=UPI0026EB37BC|nr:ABC transporter permease [Finegoldia magna]MBS5966328.1 ABC transporter permease [Finegoldia magna]MBS6720821.1 ABC transporter permease [Peptoniphilus harei]MDU4671036.1 ABC transporter permease [Finegoldia magna]
MKYRFKISILVILIISPIILGYLIPNSPFHVDVTNKFAGYSRDYLLGTDHLGRCELSRILLAGKITLKLVIISSFLIGVIGTVLGLILSMNDGVFKMVTLSIIDSITAIPTIIYLVIVVGMLENRVVTVILSLVFSITLRLIKFVLVLSQEEQKKAYCSCAKCLGASNFRIAFVHILPNIIYRILSYISLSCAEIIMTISGFSFIGINLGDTKIDWGYMLNEGRAYYNIKPTLMIYPMVLIIFFTFIFNVLSNQIKEKGNI